MNQDADPTTGASADLADVVVIGGGPAGSTAATELAARGRRVVLLEKSRHPRFHIGESLLPANLPIFARLGVADSVRNIGMLKWGAEFISSADGRQQQFEFADTWDKSQPYAYQVRRSELDEILFRNASSRGAHAIEGCRVRHVEFLEGGAGVRVHAEHEDGRRQSWHASHVIDASGRDTLLGKHFDIKRRNRRHASSALYAHFTGAVRNCDRREGNISIYWFDHGWFWFIPLRDGVTSVGAVVWPHYLQSRKVPVADFFRDTIALCPPLAERLRHAELASPVEATGNYSYSSLRSHGPNYLIAGDAYAFIDPVFSSGVMLAMNSGLEAAITLDRILTAPHEARAALRRYDRLMRHGPKEFSWFIYRVTNPTMRELFLAPRNVLRMKEALLSVLAGDIFGRTPIWASLRAFKILYYLDCAFHPQRSLRAWRRRAFNIRSADV
ncbi:MAG: NAD(P)/FAD-dependent oxidoreductase [Burkholderiales bacterium]